MTRHVSTSEVGEELASLLEAVKDGKAEVTHGIEAGISEEAVGFFSAEIWPHMQEGLPLALEGIREIVENWSALPEKRPCNATPHHTTEIFPMKGT